MRTTLLVTAAAVAFAPSAFAQQMRRPAVVVTLENRAPAAGTFQTPVWVGFHDGSFDSYDGGTPADSLPIPGSDAIERLAEDGTVGPITADFDVVVPDGVQGTMASNGPIPPLAPQGRVSRLFEVDRAVNRYFSYASMVIPSNDAFIANGSAFAHEIFDAQERFVASDFVVRGTEVNDAGTELNDELPANTAFFGQMAPDTGVTTSMNIGAHVGFLPAGSGGILDDSMFANGDFLAQNAELLGVSFRFVDRAARSRFSGLLDASQEVSPTPVNSLGLGLGFVLFRGDSDVVRVFALVRDLTGPVAAAHLHVAPMGENGPVIADVTADVMQLNTNDALIRATVTMSEIAGPLAGGTDPLGDLLAELVTGGIYLNVHTAAFPDGEVRGQLAEL